MSDRLNPMTVFEIRQMVRNRAVLSMLCLYLAVTAGLAVYQLWQILLENGEISYGSSTGSDLLGIGLGCLNFVCFILVPLSVGSVAAHQGLEDELLFETGMEVPKMYRGKILVAAVIIALFTFATMPLLTFAWILRGVDLLAVAGSLLMTFFFSLTLCSFVTASMYRCRSVGSVLGGLFGLAPVCLVFSLAALYSFSIGMVPLRNEAGSGFYVSLLGCGLFAILTCIVAIVAGTEMVRSFQVEYYGFSRLFVVLFSAFVSGFMTIAISFFVGAVGVIVSTFVGLL